MSEITHLPDIIPKGPVTKRAFLEFTRSNDMSVGLYLVPKEGEDHQSPHAEDEVYYVVRGKARFISGNGAKPVGAGDVIFVAAKEPHKFVDIVEELVLLVVFAPAYKSREQDALPR